MKIALLINQRMVSVSVERYRGDRASIVPHAFTRREDHTLAHAFLFGCVWSVAYWREAPLD